MLLIVCLLLAAMPMLASVAGDHPRPLPVTVLLDFENAHSRAPLKAMEKELSSILRDLDVDLTLRLKEDLPPNASFGELLIFKMKGHCETGSLPMGAVSDERGPLAMTYSSDGDVLPFGAVDCDRVRRSLERIFGQGTSLRCESVYGIALGRVMAHELYHMLAKSNAHTKDGVTKASLSARDLSGGSLRLPGSVQALLRKRLASERTVDKP